MTSEPAAEVGRGRRRSRRWRTAALAGGVLLLALIGSTAQVLWGIHRLQSGTLVIQRRSVRGDATIRIRVGQANHDWTPLPRIARCLQQAVVTAEDDLFWTHNGFNMRQIRESMEENRARGRVVRGGSTITMQLARNLFLSRERTWVRKAREAYYTFWMERRLSKQQILEAYLNVVEWGPDLYGIGPAARRYFGKTPAQLSVRESALLAMMLPAPKRYARYATTGMTDWSLAMVDDVLLRMRRRGVITQQEFESACYRCPTQLLPMPAMEAGADTAAGPGVRDADATVESAPAEGAFGAAAPESAGIDSVAPDSASPATPDSAVIEPRRAPAP